MIQRNFGLHGVNLCSLLSNNQNLTIVKAKQFKKAAIIAMAAIASVTVEQMSDAAKIAMADMEAEYGSENVCSEL